MYKGLLHTILNNNTLIYNIVEAYKLGNMHFNYIKSLNLIIL